MEAEKNKEKKSPDWKKIKTDYLKGISRKEICKKYGVKYETLSTRIRQGSWAKQKIVIKQKVNKKTTEKLIESLSDRQARMILKQETDSMVFWQKSLDFLQLSADPSEGKTSVEMFREAVKLARQALQISDKITIESENKSDTRMISLNVFN